MTSPPRVVLDERLDAVGAGAVVALPPDAAHHVRRVLRLGPGEAVELCDGAGRTAVGRLAGADVMLTSDPVAVPRPAPALALVQAVARGRRADDAVRTACELGVDLIVPVVADRTQGRPDATARDALSGRWRAVAGAALAQSRGAWMAEVAPVRTVAELAAAPPWDGLRLVAVPGAEPLPDVLARRAGGAATEASVGVAVGPEGGWTTEEVVVLETAGWTAVGLGPTVLRTEHAGPAALAVLAAAAGRWAADR